VRGSPRFMKKAQIILICMGPASAPIHHEIPSRSQSLSRGPSAPFGHFRAPRVWGGDVVESTDSGQSSAGDGDGDGDGDGACVIADGDSECIVCTKDKCCDEVTACAADTDCTCFSDCVDGGGDFFECFQSCSIDFQQQDAPVMDYLNCTNQSCGDVGGGGGGGGMP